MRATNLVYYLYYYVQMYDDPPYILSQHYNDDYLVDNLFLPLQALNIRLRVPLWDLRMTLQTSSRRQHYDQQELTWANPAG